jgi:GNAT superfamily N-acetyltransferase
VKASYEVMGLDTQLITDGTYFVVEDGDEIAGCGGWSRRATLFGGDHSAGRDAALLDPAHDAARVRAMYTHPDHTRKGVGRMVLDACEAAARARDSLVSRWPPPWAACRCTGPAAITTSSRSRPGPRRDTRCR